LTVISELGGRLEKRSSSNIFYHYMGEKNMKKKEPSEEITITGYVTAADWDWNDVVSAVKVETDDGDYVVAPNRLGEELFAEVDNEVEVTGILREDRDGTKRISVTSYEVLIESDYGEDDDYEYDDDGQEFGGEQGESII